MTATLEGTAELAEKLRGLSLAVQGRTLRKAVDEGMFPTYRAALATIPVGTQPHRTYTGRRVEGGFASENLRLKTWVSKDKTAAVAMVGVAPEAYYVLQFIELGTSKFPARPWLEPAFAANRDNATGRIAATMKAAIERAARRKAKAVNP